MLCIWNDHHRSHITKYLELWKFNHVLLVNICTCDSLEHNSVAYIVYFDRIPAFEAPWCITSVKSLVTLKESRKTLFCGTNSDHAKRKQKQASIDKQGEHIDTNFKDEFTSYRVTSEKNAYLMVVWLGEFWVYSLLITPTTIYSTIDPLYGV